MSVTTNLKAAQNFLKSRRGLKTSKKGLQASYTWLPKVNVDKKFKNPWSEKLSVFDYSKPMKELFADMVIYSAIIQMKRTKMFTMRCSEECQRIYSELVANAYYKAVKGLPCWIPSYDPLGFVNSHVNFAWCEFITNEKRHCDLFSATAEVPEDWSLDYQQSLQRAEELFFIGKNEEAAAAYKKLAEDHPEWNDLEPI